MTLRGQQRIGVEFKRANAPTITKSMRIAMHDLKLDALTVVYPEPAPLPYGRRCGGGAVVGGVACGKWT